MVARNTIFILNLGSTSVKGAIFEIEKASVKQISTFSKKLSDIASVKEFLLTQINNQTQLLAFVFRVVHGGANYLKPMQINNEVLAGIGEAEKIAPLHNTVLLKWIKEIKYIVEKEVLLIACFDSSFFYDLPEISKVYPAAPKIFKKNGIQKFGFHGFAHQSMLTKLNEKSKKKIISLQLGGGCSITASLNGKPIETSMGFTPLEGLMMGTRAGSIDPGIIFYLLKNGVMAEDLEFSLNHDSGFKGMVGTDDMQKILEMNTTESLFALELFCRSIVKYIGSYIAILGGVDILVFGGGIGENSPVIRQKVITALNYSGIFIDDKLNNSPKASFQKVSASNSNAEIYIIKPDEELEMAKEVQALLMGKQ